MLNQDEIRDLLSNPSSSVGGGMWSGEANPYDFLKAALKKDEKLQGAADLHVQAAKPMEKQLSDITERAVTVEASSPEVMAVTQALADFNPEQNLAFSWNDETAGCEGLFQIDRAFFFQVYANSFGGKKGGSRAGALTGLERKFLERLMAPLIETLQNSWRANGNFRFNVSSFLEDKTAIEALTWNFDCFKTTFKISAEGIEGGAFSAVFPRVMLNSIASAGASAGDAPVESKATRDKTWVDAVTGAISEKQIPVSINLGVLRVPLQKILALKPGEEFPLILSPEGQSVSVNGRIAYRATIGTADGLRAVRVTGKDGGESDE